MVRHRDFEAAVVHLVDAPERCVEAEIDPLGDADLEQPVAQALVIAAQQLVRSVHDRDLAAKFVENARELVGDVASACDQNARRQRVEMERLIAGDPQFVARTIGHVRPRSGRDEDVLRSRRPAAAERYLVRASQRRPIEDHLDAVVLERVGVKPVEAVDIAQHVVAQHRPVEPRVIESPPEALCIDQVLGEVRAVDEHLLGHAAADHASAAYAVLLGDRDLGPVGGGDPAGAHAARSRADDEQIVVVSGLGHARLLSGTRIWRGRQAMPTTRRTFTCRDRGPRDPRRYPAPPRQPPRYGPRWGRSPPGEATPGAR